MYRMSESWRKHFMMRMAADGAGGGGGSGAGDGAGDEGGEKTPEKTPEELRAEVEAEVRKGMEAEIDKRVTEAVKKTEKRLRDAQAQKEKEQAMTEEEKRKAEADKLAAEQSQRMRQLTEKELRLDLVDILNDNEMDLAFRDLVEVGSLVELPAEERSGALAEKVSKIKKLFDAEVAKAVKAAKEEFLKGKTPADLGDKKPPAEDAYTAAKNRGDVRGMIAAKREKAEAERNKGK